MRVFLKIGIILMLLSLVAACGWVEVQDTSTSEIPTENIESSSESAIEESAEDQDDEEYREYGELLDQYDSGDGLCVLKYKITPSYSNETTIRQNYHTVVAFIRDGGGDQYTEIQYWAVADMESGSEDKVISFTLYKDVIQGVTDGSIVAIHLDQYADDLWVLPSLID